VKVVGGESATGLRRRSGQDAARSIWLRIGQTRSAEQRARMCCWWIRPLGLADIDGRLCLMVRLQKLKETKPGGDVRGTDARTGQDAVKRADEFHNRSWEFTGRHPTRWMAMQGRRGAFDSPPSLGSH